MAVNTENMITAKHTDVNRRNRLSCSSALPVGRIFFALKNIWAKNRHDSRSICVVLSTGGVSMNITVKEYTLLFNAVTNALERLEALKFALILAQQQAEEIVIAKNSLTVQE